MKQSEFLLNLEKFCKENGVVLKEISSEGTLFSVGECLPVATRWRIEVEA